MERKKEKMSQQKAIESRVFPGKHYKFGERLGKGTQASVFKFHLDN